MKPATRDHKEKVISNDKLILYKLWTSVEEVMTKSKEEMFIGIVWSSHEHSIYKLLKCHEEIMNNL